MTLRRKVQRIIDGDTFVVRTNVGGSNYIRIANKDSPEKWQFGYDSAKESLKRQIQGKTVTLQPVGRSYGRVVAKVRVGRRLIR